MAERQSFVIEEPSIGDRHFRPPSHAPGAQSLDTRVVNERDFRQRMFIDRAVEPSAIKLEDFARFIVDERKVAERIVKDSGLTPE